MMGWWAAEDEVWFLAQAAGGTGSPLLSQGTPEERDSKAEDKGWAGGGLCIVGHPSGDVKKGVVFTIRCSEKQPGQMCGN